MAAAALESSAVCTAASVAKLERGSLELLEGRRKANTAPAGFGPRAALENLKRTEQPTGSMRAWVEEARLAAILGSCSLSVPSLRSGLRCYIAFVGRAARVHDVVSLCGSACIVDQVAPNTKCYFPPCLDFLLAWSTLFRSEGTLSNYLGYVRTGCLLAKAPTQVMVVI